MLQFSTVKPCTLALLKELVSLPALTNFNLVGDTNLALRYGHRVLLRFFIIIALLDLLGSKAK